jgi:hypothetical protein
VSIYAFKPNYLLGKGNSDSNINYAMQVGKILGASHVTLELPRKPEHSLKLGQLAEKTESMLPIMVMNNKIQLGGIPL